MKRDKIYFIIIAVLIVSNLVFLKKKKTTIYETGQVTWEYDSKLFDKLGEILFNNMQWQWIGEGDTLRKNILLETEDFKQLSLMEILNGKKIVFRFSERQCPSCIDAQMSLIKLHEKIFNKDDIILLASPLIKRNILIKKNEYKIKHSLYFIEEEGLKIKIEKLNMPYYFVTDKNYVVDLVFVPVKEIPLITKHYFANLNNRFFNNQ